MNMQNFNSLASIQTPDGKIKDFLKENLEFSKSEKSSNQSPKRHLLPNFEPYVIFRSSQN
jgi:hypothetical protein